MLRAIMALGLALLSVGLADSADAKKRTRGGPSEKWVLIATQELDPAKTNQTIDTSMAKGSIKALRIEARNGSVDFSKLEFVYDGTQSYTVDKRFNLKSGERTKAIDERDTERFLNQVKVTYSAPPDSKRQTQLQVYALQTSAGRTAKRESPPNVATGSSATGQIETSATDSRPLAIEPGAIIEGRDVMFGYQNVGFGIDRDKIPVGSQVGKFEYLRLRVLDNAVRILQLTVNYVDGTAQSLVVDADIGANQKTKWFRVNGREFIKDIEMTYRSKPSFKGQARIEVVGQFADGWLKPGGEGQRYNQGWVLLGSETAGALGYDKDTVSIAKNEGGFAKVRLNVRDRSITLREVRVVYENGTDEVIRMNERVDPGQAAGPWELKTGLTPIKEIVATYRTRLVFGKGKGAGVVEFWGQH